MTRIILLVLGFVLFVTLVFGAGWVVGHRADQQPPDLKCVLQAVGGSEQFAESSEEVDTAQSFSPVEVPPPSEASVLFVGDVLPLQDRDYFQQASELIQSADFAVCNLECPLSTHGRPCPTKLAGNGDLLPDEYLFRAPPGQARRLSSAGFDAVTLANNHAMDYSAQALLESLRVLDEAGIQHTGAGIDEANARKPIISVIKRQTVGVLAYVSANTLPSPQTFEAKDHLAGTAFVRSDNHGKPTAQTRQMLQNDIRRLTRRSDFVVVCFHWGTEAQDNPDPFPRHLARWAIDCGANMVVGHHPHKLQGVEIYRGRPIAYSLGNFAFPTSWESNHFSAALEVRLCEGRWQRLVLRPVRLRYRAGDPAPARGRVLRRIVNRVSRLSEKLGTTCVYQNSGKDPQIVIQNEAATGSREQLLIRERRHFHVEPHPDLDGMSIVHFLAWDLEDPEKMSRELRVVVKKDLGSEVLEIFKEIYLSDERFPIHEVLGYDYRTVTGGSGLSYHALGRAIDINRRANPMIRNGQKVVHPDEPPYEPGEWQPGKNPYSMPPDGSVVKAFKSRGWRWGGDWTSCSDYQHFDKPAN